MEEKRVRIDRDNGKGNESMNLMGMIESRFTNGMNLLE